MLLLDVLNERQKEAALHKDGPLLIVAGAGAGKTKTITHRIVHLMREGIPGRNILALTFTNKAALEMRERVLRLLGPSVSELPLVCTFHSLCVRILREFGERIGVPERFSIWDREDQEKAMKRTLKGIGMEEENPLPVLAAISREKGAGTSSNIFAERARTPREQEISHAWERYEATLKEASALDFDDLLLRVFELLKRPKSVRDLLQNRWHYIVIDEYQDTNTIQYEIARLLAGERQNVCAVGDLDQCIYTWRQAKLENLLSFERAFPKTKVVKLEENYRSTGSILAAANDVIEKNTKRIPKVLKAMREVGEPLYFFEAENEMDEAYFCGEKTEELLKKAVPAKEIALLYRSNFQSRVLEEALLSLGVPYRVIGTRFFERKEVKDVLAYMRAALHPASSHDLSRIIATPPRGIGRMTLEKMLAGRETDLPDAARAKITAFRGMLSHIARAIETLPLSEAMRFLLKDSGLERMYKDKNQEEREHFENVKELVNLAARYDHHLPPSGAYALLEEAALQSDQDELRDEENCVSLMTVHAAKGLEFDTIFVTGLEQGLFPTLKLDVDADPEEERRLFYVALTRAKERVFLSFARSRARFGRREGALPSEFIADIDQRLLAPANIEKEGERVIE